FQAGIDSMSGIAGVIRFDEQNVLEVDIAGIVKSLAHRGEVVRQAIDSGLLLAFGGILEADPVTGTHATADADVFAPSIQDNVFTSAFTRGGSPSFNDINADFA